MCLAVPTNHVIATPSFLGADIAGWARRGMYVHVLFASTFGVRELFFVAWTAKNQGAVPGGFADGAEGEGAVCADYEAVFVRGFLCWTDGDVRLVTDGINAS